MSGASSSWSIEQAAEAGDADVLKLLLGENGALNVSSTFSAEGRQSVKQALVGAARGGHVACVRLLLERGGAVWSGEAILAALTGMRSRPERGRQCAEALIHADLRLHPTPVRTEQGARDAARAKADYNRLLVKACLADNVAGALLILQETEPDVDAVASGKLPKSGAAAEQLFSPLLAAVARASPELVKALLRAKARPSLEVDGRDPLSFAFKRLESLEPQAGGTGTDAALQAEAESLAQIVQALEARQQELADTHDPLDAVDLAAGLRSVSPPPQLPGQSSKAAGPQPSSQQQQTRQQQQQQQQGEEARAAARWAIEEAETESNRKQSAELNVVGEHLRALQVR
jgi:hypothetical protein